LQSQQLKDLINDAFLKLSPLQQIAFNSIVTDRKNNYIIMAGAGSGKSTVADLIGIEKIKLFGRAAVQKMAFRNIVAVNNGGQTINSYFHLGQLTLFNGLTDEEMRKLAIDAKHKLFTFHLARYETVAALSVIIIDEIQQVEASLLTFINVLLQLIKGKENMPFGGIQMIIVGDLRQKPQVSLPFNKSPIIRLEGPFPTFLCAYIGNGTFRQTDTQQILLLNKLRYNDLDDECVKTLNDLVGVNADIDDDTLDIILSSVLASAKDVEAYCNSKPCKQCRMNDCTTCFSLPAYERKQKASADIKRLTDDGFIADCNQAFKMKVRTKGNVLPTLVITDEIGLRDRINEGRHHCKLNESIKVKVSNNLKIINISLVIY